VSKEYAQRLDSVALVERAAAAGEDIEASLQLARTYGPLVPLPGSGDTDRRFAVLSALGQANLTVARVFEAHTDAIAILAEAGVYDETGANVTYGVFAAEGPGEPLRAESDGGGGFRLTGIKPWCSLGSHLDSALITAEVFGGRQLFRVDLHDLSVTADPTTGWVARGLRSVTSTSLRFDATPVQPIGAVDWYLTRAGFSWGGIGVAACWYGGALGLGQSLIGATSPLLDPLSALALGNTDALLHAAKAVLTLAATMIDGGEATGAAGEVLALRTRAIVADAAEQILREVGHALGPAPLAFNEEHARRAADLTLYVRQHHGERDLAALGRAVAGAER
jgi:alkylation response protein AidB-like acyl-CoA dehydrogenase